MPDATGSKAGEKHNQALKDMGLLDESGQPSWIVKGDDGKTDWMQSLLKLTPALGEKLYAMPETERLSKMDQIFGKQGGREAGLMNLKEFVDQFPVLAEKMKNAKTGDAYLEQLSGASTMQQAREAFTNLKIVLLEDRHYRAATAQCRPARLQFEPPDRKRWAT